MAPGIGVTVAAGVGLEAADAIVAAGAEVAADAAVGATLGEPSESPLQALTRIPNAIMTTANPAKKIRELDVMNSSLN
jgi:hypothetical protein